MTTITLSGKEYQLGRFSELQMLPFARFFNAMRNESLLDSNQTEELITILSKSTLNELTDDILERLNDVSIPVPLWKELAETLVDIIVPDIPLELVNPTIRRGIFLSSKDMLALYLACIEQLKADDIFSGDELDELEKMNDTLLEKDKEVTIKELKEKLASLEA